MRRANGSEGAAKVWGHYHLSSSRYILYLYLFPTAQHMRLRFWPFFA